MIETPQQCQKALIGAILLDRRVMDRCVQADCHAGWFGDDCAIVYGLMLEMYGAGTHIDLLTLWNAISASVSNNIPLGFLDECVDACPSSTSATHYLEIIKNGWRRDVAQNLAGLHKVRLQESEDIEASCADISAEWSDFCIGGVGEDKRTNAEVARELVERWRDPGLNPQDVLWPLGILNRNIGPLTDEFVIIAAKESVGKTAWALQMCMMLGRRGLKSDFNSLESRRDKLMGRMISNEGQVNTLRLKRRMASDAEFDDIIATVIPRIAVLPIAITDASMNSEQIHAWAKASKNRGSRLLVIDNARHVRPSKTYRTETERMMDLSLSMKWVRDECGLPLILLHHLASDGDLGWARMDMRKDADIILLMTDNEEHSIDPGEHGPGLSIVDFEVAKNRDGLKNFVAQGEFVKSTQTFADWPAEMPKEEYE